MTDRSFRPRLAVLATFAFLPSLAACGLEPGPREESSGISVVTGALNAARITISQVYGGGGNASGKYRHGRGAA